MKALLLLIVCFLGFGYKGWSQTTTLILVRHAEQEKLASNDPPLSEQGKSRAELLAKTLAKLPLAAAYTTTLLRAKASAEPVALLHHIKLAHYKMEEDETAFVSSILKAHSGKNILLIGHSGNIADLLNAATRSKDYDEKAVDGFADLYVITFSGTAPGVVTHLSY